MATSRPARGRRPAQRLPRRRTRRRAIAAPVAAPRRARPADSVEELDRRQPTLRDGSRRPVARRPRDPLIEACADPRRRLRAAALARPVRLDDARRVVAGCARLRRDPTAPRPRLRPGRRSGVLRPRRSSEHGSPATAVAASDVGRPSAAGRELAGRDPRRRRGAWGVLLVARRPPAIDPASSTRDLLGDVAARVASIVVAAGVGGGRRPSAPPCRRAAPRRRRHRQPPRPRPDPRSASSTTPWSCSTATAAAVFLQHADGRSTAEVSRGLSQR